MDLTADDFARVLHALTPRGAIWPDGFRPGAVEVASPNQDYGTGVAPTGGDDDQGTVPIPSGQDVDFGEVAAPEESSNMSNVFRSLGDEYALLNGRVRDFVEKELDPATAVELLPEWEKQLGLPDPCITGPQTLQERQLAAAAKLLAVGGQSRAYYLQIATSVGASVVIHEYQPLRSGYRVGARCYGTNWVGTWDVQSDLGLLTVLRSGYRVGARMREWGNELLECTVGPRAPAHTRVRFTYGTKPSLSSDLDFGTVDNPPGTDLDFGTALVPAGEDIDEGSL